MLHQEFQESVLKHLEWRRLEEVELMHLMQMEQVRSDQLEWVRQVLQCCPNALSSSPIQMMHQSQNVALNSKLNIFNKPIDFQPNKFKEFRNFYQHLLMFPVDFDWL